MKEFLHKCWDFLKADTWQSWTVSLLLAVISIKFIFFPLLSLITGSPLPLVVIESCSMYHEADFPDWWEKNSEWYERKEITKEKFDNFPFKNGLMKGDIIVVWGKSSYNIGDIIIFNADQRYPIIHRLVSLAPLATKGDHNSDHLPDKLEEDIPSQEVIGKAVARIPFLGWVKLIFFDILKPEQQRGFCR